MLKKKYLFFVIILAIGLTAFSGQVINYVNATNQDYYYEIKENQKLFGRIYEEISMRYVETIDPSKFIRSGINGMLGELDPYTVFIEKEDNIELKIMTKGKYGGLGMRIIKREGFPTIIEPPMSETPAERAGIREGDQIIEINGKSTTKLSVDKTAKLLRGKPGTKVSITIKRAGEPEPIEFHLIRAVIEVKDITYKGMISDDIGYVQLSHFSKDAGKEVRQAIEELKLQGMQKMILDLRSNPGGLLDAAVKVTDNFLQKGEPVVSTKGRFNAANQDYISENSPIWGDNPLVILVDGGSASASEITSGAIQDLDRGVIIGSPTFGKGLVQTLVHVSNEADLKLTTAKYYIPSGRLIQKKDVFHRGEENVFLNSGDSTDIEIPSADQKTKKSAKIFRTRNNRSVKEGNGITPDISVKGTTYNRFRTTLIRKSMFFGFAVQYCADHPDLKIDSEVTQSMLDAFREYLKVKKFDYKPAGLSYLDKFEKAIKKEKLNGDLKTHLDGIKKILEAGKEAAFTENTEFISTRLKMEIAAKLGGTKAKLETVFHTDPAILKAIETLEKTEYYYSILQGDAKTGDPKNRVVVP